MIELVVLNYLKSELPDITVTAEIRQGMGDTFVSIEKTGGGMNDKLFSSTFAVQSWAGSLYDAMSLNERVKEAMLELPSVKEVTKCSLNSDYNYTDTATKHPRYQAVFDVVHY